jgi:hypothetical protein
MAEYPQPEFAAEPRPRETSKPSKQETLRRIRLMRDELSEKGKLLPKGI